MIYWNPLYTINFSKNSVTFKDERGIKKLRLPNKKLFSTEILKKLKIGIDKSYIDNVTKGDQELLGILFRKKLIISAPSNFSASGIDPSLSHFLTFHPFPIIALEKIRNSHICILGIGGIGAVVLQHLVALGIKKYTFVDCDKVTKSNLNRQFIYGPADIGKSKVEIAKKYVESIFDDMTEVSIFQKKINTIEILEKLEISNCDFIINCFDTPRKTIDDIVYQYGENHNIPVIGAGVGVYAGHWGPLLDPKVSPTYEQWKKSYLKKPSLDNISEKYEPIYWSFGPTNTLISAYLVRDVIEWLSDHPSVRSKNCRLVLDFTNNKLLSFGIDAKT